MCDFSFNLLKTAHRRFGESTFCRIYNKYTIYDGETRIVRIADVFCVKRRTRNLLF